jgi:hypothetical protein
MVHEGLAVDNRRWWRDADISFGAFATEAGTGSGTVEIIASHLLTFEREAVRSPSREV